MFRINILFPSSGLKNISSAVRSFVTLKNTPLTFSYNLTSIALNIISNTATDYYTFTFAHSILLSVGDKGVPRSSGIHGRTGGTDYRGIWTTEGKLRCIGNIKQDWRCRHNVTLRRVLATTVAVEKQ